MHRGEFEKAYVQSLSSGEEHKTTVDVADNKDITPKPDRQDDDLTTEPLNVTIRPNADNEIDPMVGASGLHGKDFDAQKKTCRRG